MVYNCTGLGDRTGVAAGDHPRNHVVNVLGRLGWGARVEGRLRVVFDAELDCLGNFGVGEFRGHGEGEIDSGGDTGACEDTSSLDDPLFGRSRAVTGEVVVGGPVGGGELSVE